MEHIQIRPSSGANLLIFCFALDIFHSRLFFPQSIYLFALSDFFEHLTDDKENKNQKEDSYDGDEEEDNERRTSCALLCVRIQIYAALAGKLKRGEGPFE